MSFFTDLPITESAILSTLRKFEGCLGVEGWLKTGNKGHYFQAWFSLEVSAKFLVVLLTRDSAERLFIKVVTTRKLLISVAKVTKLWLSIVQHLTRWPPFFIAYLQSTCLREHLFKIWEKSIWYFYHARATLLISFVTEEWDFRIETYKDMCDFFTSRTLCKTPSGMYMSVLFSSLPH